MKILIVLVSAIAVACADFQEEKSCYEEPEPGHCRGAFPAWYYNFRTQSCREFVYGGCGGNGNRYNSEEECLKNCEDEVTSVLGAPNAVCELPKETGRCFGYFPRYHFSQEAGQCVEFIYGGCGGNGNNFKTIEECRGVCEQQPRRSYGQQSFCDKSPDVGHCRGAFPRFYFDPKKMMCQKFVYGGCGGNYNNFATEADCYNTCGVMFAPVTHDCNQDKDPGRCRARIPRYYFNKRTGQCESFAYGGCGGNSNNFEEKEDCEAACSS